MTDKFIIKNGYISDDETEALKPTDDMYPWEEVIEPDVTPIRITGYKGTIEELEKEFRKYKPKFEVGDEVYVVSGNDLPPPDPREIYNVLKGKRKIIGIDASEAIIKYTFSKYSVYTEDRLFVSWKDAINSAVDREQEALDSEFLSSGKTDPAPPESPDSGKS